MKRNLLLLGVMIVAVLSFTLQNAGASCPQDPNDMGICDTLYVKTFDGDQTYTATAGYDSVRVALYVTHDSNTFYSSDLGKWAQDSIMAFVIPLEFWKEGCADSVIFPTYGNWNNKIIDPDSAKFNRSMFRHLEDPQTGDTVYNRFALMHETGLADWNVVTSIVSHDPGQVFLALINMGPNTKGWWEGSRTLLATMTFLVYMGDDCDSTAICLDSTFWPPTNRLRFFRYDAVGYFPRHFLPVCDSIYVGVSGTPSGLSYIRNVPDWNQPPLSGSTNYCSPTSALNILDYYDPSSTPGLVDPADAPRYPDSSNTADLIGWFMGTNGAGSSSRWNKPPNAVPGTYWYDPGYRSG